MNTLQVLLAEVSKWAQANAPAWYAALQPGLSPAALAETAAPLAPYRLPAAVTTLYRWHNGQPEPESFVHPYTFLPLAAAVALYRQLRTEDESWHPRWFPLLTFQGDHLVILLSEAAAETTPVWLAQGEETHLFRWYDDLAGMVQTVLACYRNGVYAEADGFWEADEAKETAVRLRYNPNAHNWDASDNPATAVSRFDESKWPAAWKEKHAPDQGKAAAKGSSPGGMSIAAYLAHAPGGKITLQGKVTQLVGSPKETFILLTDDTGSIPLYAAGRLARKLRIRNSYTLVVQAGAEEHTIFIDPSLATRIAIKKIL